MKESECRNIDYIKKREDLFKIYNHLHPQLYSIKERLDNKNARRYLHEGIIRRMAMMRFSFLEITEKFIEQKEGLDNFEIVKLNIYLNSYYINLRGILDNIAWIILYELKPFGKCDENKKHFRFRADLNNKEFKKEISKIIPGFSVILRTYKTWIDNIKLFRDPIAHRIPIVIPPGVIKNKQKYEKHIQEYNKLLENGNFHDAFGLKLAEHKLADFEPSFILSDCNGLKLYPGREKTFEDFENILVILNFFIDNILNNFT